MRRDECSVEPARRRRGGAALAALLLLIALPPSLRAEEESPRALLNRASDFETVQGNLEAALKIYERVATAKGFSQLPAADRAEALAGAARCHAAASNADLARKFWERIRADEALPDETRTWASRELDDLRRREESANPRTVEGDRELTERLRKEDEAKRKRRAARLLEQAEVMFQTDQLKSALELCLRALSFDETNEEAHKLRRRIEARSPDLGNLLEQLIQFFQTQELTEYENLRERERALDKDGRAAFNRKDWAEADRNFREGIRLLDESGFLTLGGALDTGSLDADRASLVVWLRETIDRAAADGIQLAPEPAPPDLDARRGGLQQQFFSIASKIFTPRGKGDAPLHFYKFAPVYKRGAGAQPRLDRIFFDGLRATHRTGRLTRAHWAERWIRDNIGARWIDPSSGAHAGSSRRSGRRVLLRLGDLICAQHRPDEQARIEKLRSAFAKTPPPIVAQVIVFAASSAGSVGAAEALRVRAGPRDPGMAHVVSGTPITECAKALEAVPGVVKLGNARISFDGHTALLMELTQMTADHPAYAQLPTPALTVPDAASRYGLWLDLYAEQMVDQAKERVDRSAIALRARVVQPDELVPSHVVPRASGLRQPFTRLPLLTEVSRETTQSVPHYGALFLQGLPNPFPQTRAEHSELLVLIGTARKETPNPDPPRAPPSPRIDPANTPTKDYLLGSLSVEVADDVLPEGWPDRRTTKEGVSASDRRRLRNLNLVSILTRMAQLDPEAPGGRDALDVHDHRVTATLTEAQHLQLQRAITRLRSFENDLYATTILAAVVDRPTWRTWSQLPDVTPNRNGNFVATGKSRTMIESDLAALANRPGLFNTRRTLLIRATQQLAHVNLNARTITKDLQVRLLPQGKQRYTAETGYAEEGLIVEVRPGLESSEQTGSFRTVRVRARAARLERVESRPYPGATQQAAVYHVPVWYPGTNGPFSHRTDAEALSDDSALLLPLKLPGAEDKVILVLVAVKKLQ